MPPRAPALSPQERRDAIVTATIPLLRRHGRDVTTRQIAEAACIAEGTIFRVFDAKSDVIEAAIQRAFDRRPSLAELDGIDPELPLRERLVALVTWLQGRFLEIFELMNALGMVSPPDSHLAVHDDPEFAAAKAQAQARALAVVGEPTGLRVSPQTLLHYLRLLTFSGSHAQIAEGTLLTPAEIVDLVLDGVRKDF